MTAAVATRRKERSEITTAEAPRERPADALPPVPRAKAARNGAALEEEAAKFARPPAVSRPRPDPAAEGDDPGGQSAKEAALLGEYNLYNG